MRRAQGRTSRLVRLELLSVLYEAEPKIGVISCGKDNDYGHPHEETLSRLNDAGVTVYRTDLEGSIVIFSDGMKVERRAA